MFVFNSSRYLIWENKTELELPVLYSTSVHHAHRGQAASKKLFGFPIKFKDSQSHQMHFDKIEHEQEMMVSKGLISNLHLHMKFIEDMYYYEYYGLLDFLA